MRKRLLSLVSCVLIACNIFSTISYAEEVMDVTVEDSEVISKEVEIVETDTPVEEDVEADLQENIENTEVIVEETTEEDTDSESEEKILPEEEAVEDSEGGEDEKEKEKYTVSFVDSIDESIFAEYIVIEGESVDELPEPPTHDGYEFVEYDGNYTEVIKNEEVIAVFDASEDEENLVYRELVAELSGYSITVSGKMPKNTELDAKQIESAEAEETIKSELDIEFKAQVSFDINLVVGNEQYQPTEYGESVSVSIKGVNTSEELDVYRITDDGSVTDMSASDINETVEFETDHFTTYTIGTTQYESLSTGTFLGLNFEYYDIDGDGIEDQVVVTGEQTTPYWVRYKDDAECDELLKKYTKGTAYNYYGGKSRLSFLDTNDHRNEAPWENSHITRCHFKDVKLLNAYALFWKCKNLEEIVLENVDTSECFDMGMMFSGCTSMSKLTITNTLNTTNVTLMDEMFYNCGSLKTFDGEHNFNGTTGAFTDTSKVESFDSMFYDAIDLESIDLSFIDGTSAQSMRDMFDISGNGSYGHESKLKTIKLPSNLKLASDVTRMFAYNVRLEDGFDTSNWDTSRVTTMDHMFFNCFNLKEIDVSNWDTSNVTNMGHAFDGCNALEVLDVSNWDVSKVTDMTAALSSLHNVKVIDVSNWDTSSCQKMEDLFWQCRKVTALDVSNWNVSKVKSMDRMFTECQSIAYLDLSKWDVSNVEEFGNDYSTHIFHYCDKLTVIDMFRTDVIKADVGIPPVPEKDIGYHSVHGPNYMYIDDNKDGKADSAYEKYTVFKKDSVSHRYIFDDNLEYPENSLGIMKSKYTFLFITEPSDGPEAIGPHPDDVTYGTFIRKGPYLVENFEVLDTRMLDENDVNNSTGRALVYTLNIDGDIVKALAGDSTEYPGADGTYGTEDDEKYWECTPAKYIMWASYNSNDYTSDEMYEWHKNFIKYKTNEVVTLSKEDWDYQVANTDEMYYKASSFKLAKFKLTLKDEEGKILYSNYVMYEDDILSILAQYGSKWLDTDGNRVNVSTMPLESLTLRLEHTHVAGTAVEENRVNPTHTSSGHYDSVVYCRTCGVEMNREEVTIPASTHKPAAAVEENKVNPTCTEPGHYESVVYCEDDGAELSRTRIEIEPLGHAGNPAVKENITEATEDSEGSYDAVVYCSHCHKELSRESKSIAKLEKHIPEKPGNENKDDSGKTKPENNPSDSGKNESGDSSQPSGTVDIPENTIIEEVEVEEEIIENIVDESDSENSNVITVSSSNGGSRYVGEDNIDYENIDIVASSEDNQLHRLDLTSSNESEDKAGKRQAFIEKVVKAVVVTVTTTSTAGGFFFVFIWFRRRKIRGKLVSRENLTYSNCLITLEGKDKLSTRTNKKGEFTFRNLKKDSYILSIFDESDELIFQGEIYMGKNGNFKTIINNGTGEHFEKVGETYFVNILA